MIVDIDKETRIRSDERCWRLERVYIAKGLQRWKAVGYYTTFENAVKGAYHREIRLVQTHGLEECLRAAEETLEKYKAILFDQMPGVKV